MTGQSFDTNTTPTAKDKILCAIRQRQQAKDHNRVNTTLDHTNTHLIQQQASALLDISKYTRAQLQGDNLCDAFVNKINTGRVIGTTCEVITSQQDIPKVIERFLIHNDLPSQLAIQKIDQLTQLDWGTIATDMDVTQEGSVSVCVADYAIAETGSVVIHSSKHMPVLQNFLCLHQIVIVERHCILAYLDDYGLIANTAASNKTSPRNACIITGCSGTTDIEGVLVRGAHGPESVHIVVVN